MYNLLDHGYMIADRARVEAYARALRQVVRPESIVVDIGTGTGVFALLACRSGARRVYAIEPDDIIDLARKLAAANGCASRVEFLQARSTEISLPEPADVIVSDLRGVLPWFRDHIPSIADARRRFLAPGGVLIPRRDTLWAAPVEAPELYARVAEPWESNGAGLDMRAGGEMAVHMWCKGRVAPEQLVAPPACWSVLDYASVEDPDACGQATWTVVRDTTGHGLIAWLDSTLCEGVSFSNAPGQAELIYGSAFFPWLSPVALHVGDTISMTIATDLVGDDYVWRWQTSVFEEGDPGRVKARFEQSTFQGAPLSAGSLRKLDAAHLPELGEEGEIDQFILVGMDGRTSLREIAQRLAARFPARFPTWDNALRRVAILSEKYSR